MIRTPSAMSAEWIRLTQSSHVKRMRIICVHSPTAHVRSNRLRREPISADAKVILGTCSPASYTTRHNQSTDDDATIVLHRLQTQPSPSKANNRMRESAENAVSAHDQWICYETLRSQGSAQTNICFEAFLFVNQKTGSCEINRPRPEQTIEWDNLVRAREVRVRNRTIFPFRFLSDKHAHYNSSPQICSFDCLHWSEAVDWQLPAVGLLRKWAWVNKY